MKFQPDLEVEANSCRITTRRGVQVTGELWFSPRLQPRRATRGNPHGNGNLTLRHDLPQVMNSTHTLPPLPEPKDLLSRTLRFDYFSMLKSCLKSYLLVFGTTSLNCIVM